ncbi:MAG: hypothetical protein H0T92_14210, partial [Pyrinomonadaceae bacterium]|nr:hypothetical protein [Pyrinomonadaceae bacterium]
MNIYEIDWRHSSIREILNAISAALVKITNDESHEDVDEALEQLESFLGIAFVTAQTYITGTAVDARKLTKSTPKPNKHDLLKNFSDVISGTGVTKMKLCDATANYYKHHDEWLDWTPNPTERRKHTIDVLNGVGITETTTYPCQEAANILWGSNAADLEPLLSILVE